MAEATTGKSERQLQQNLPGLPPTFVVSANPVVIAFHEERLLTPLFIRKPDDPEDPFAGSWCVPGGPILEDETPEEACYRHIAESVHVELTHLQQLKAFAAPQRDPRRRTMTIAHCALVRIPEEADSSGGGENGPRWFDLDALPEEPFAFDHREILTTARDWLKDRLPFKPMAFGLMPEEFSLPALQSLFEVALGESLDRRNFYKKIKSMDMLDPTRKERVSRGKPTQLYRYDPVKYELARLDPERLRQ